MDSVSFDDEEHVGSARTERPRRPTTCQHEHYERRFEGGGFARSQCMGCPRSWVEVDISVEQDSAWRYGEPRDRDDRRRRIRGFGSLFEGDAAREVAAQDRNAEGTRAR
jgi:hypothetical protein